MLAKETLPFPPKRMPKKTRQYPFFVFVCIVKLDVDMWRFVLEVDHKEVMALHLVQLLHKTKETRSRIAAHRACKDTEKSMKGGVHMDPLSACKVAKVKSKIEKTYHII